MTTEELAGLFEKLQSAGPSAEAFNESLAALDTLSRLAEMGRRWEEDSSLEKWFPITAEELVKLKAENEELLKMKAAVETAMILAYNNSTA